MDLGVGRNRTEIIRTMTGRGVGMSYHDITTNFCPLPSFTFLHAIKFIAKYIVEELIPDWAWEVTHGFSVRRFEPLKVRYMNTISLNIRQRTLYR
jgi:hypothetical protein